MMRGRAAREFGLRLSRLRARRGFAAALVAELVGVSEETFLSWENDYSSPLPGDVDRLAEVLGFDPDVLKHGGRRFEQRLSTVTRLTSPDPLLTPGQYPEATSAGFEALAFVAKPMVEAPEPILTGAPASRPAPVVASSVRGIALPKRAPAKARPMVTNSRHDCLMCDAAGPYYSGFCPSCWGASA